MVDFGLVSMFAIQLSLVLLVYHAWKGIKSEISAINTIKDGNRDVLAKLAALEGERDTLIGRMDAVEAEPKARRNRIDELEDLVKKTERNYEALETKISSTAARVSAFARHRKVKEEESELDQASQDEGDMILKGSMPPGSIPLFERTQPETSAIPPGFGVVGKRSRHG